MPFNPLSEAVAPLPTTREGPDVAGLKTSFPHVDTLTISGATLPGKWTLIEAKKKFGWDIRKGYALDGAFVVPTGDELVVAKFKGEFWSQADFGWFKIMRSQLLKKPVLSLGGIALAHGINHPELKALGVTSVVVLEVGALMQSEGGLWEIQIDFLQYRPPKIATIKPTGATPDVPPVTPTASNLRQLEIQKLTAQAKALLGK